MRKLYSVFLLFGCLFAQARQISPIEAMNLASDFMNSKELQSASYSSKSLTPMKAPGVHVDAKTSPYYVFNHGESDGFVIISGDDCAPKILGYSDKGSFDADNLPPQLKAMMEQWAKQMENLPTSASQHPSWTVAPSTRSGEVLLETANWGQYAPFNDLCPTVDGVKAPAGCVATAMAIAMKYHNWPDSTRGGEEYDFYFPEEKFDFDSYSIDWNALSNENNTEFAAQAAKLTYSAGIAAQMMYGPSESFAESWAVDHSFIYFYAYGKDCQFIPRYKFTESEWNDMLRNQLSEVGPVVYNGFGSGGHTFVIDGYNSEGLYHVNWGWNGALNGYYTLEFSLDNGMSFNEDHGMVINLSPDRTKTKYSKIWISNADAYASADDDAWNFWNPDIVEGVPNTYISPNICISNFQGYVRLAIADEEDRIVSWADDISHQKNGFRYLCARPGGNIMGENVELAPLQKGQRYQLYSQEVPNGPGWTDEDYHPANPPSDNPEDWQMVVGGMKRPSCFYAEGNRSRISEVRVHIADNLPAYCESYITFDKEFSILRMRGYDCPLVMHVPDKGVKYEMFSSDNDGTEHEVLYVDWGSDDDSSFLGLNITMYADQFDIYFSYEEDGETRKDKGIPADQIVEKDGLVYRIVDDKLNLIGYDKLGESVCIPETVLVGDQEIPVRFISDMALAFAPIKNLDIDSKTLEFGKFVFAGTSNLESISVKDMSLTWDHYQQYGFIDSGLKTVCFDAVPDNSNMIVYFTGYAYNYNYMEDKFYGVPSVKDLDFVMTSTPVDATDRRYFSNILNFIMPVDDLSNAFNSYMIPGLGKSEVLSYVEEIPFNVCQMWNYDIDRNNCMVLIKDILPDVQIENVIINGTEAVVDTDGIYVGDSNASGMDVIVNYTVKGLKKTTQYSPGYNNSVEQTDLSGVQGVFTESGNIDIITLDGIQILKNCDRESLKSLTPGIYIIRNGADMKKLVIR